MYPARDNRRLQYPEVSPPCDPIGRSVVVTLVIHYCRIGPLSYRRTDFITVVVPVVRWRYHTFPNEKLWSLLRKWIGNGFSGGEGEQEFVQGMVES